MELANETFNNADGCNKPLLDPYIGNKNKWAEYYKCMGAKAAKEKAEAAELIRLRDAEQKRLKDIEDKKTGTGGESETSTGGTAPTKFFSTMAGKATIGVIGVLVLVGGFLAYKKFKK